jgi:hypothetical protein
LNSKNKKPKKQKKTKKQKKIYTTTFYPQVTELINEYERTATSILWYSPPSMISSDNGKKYLVLTNQEKGYRPVASSTPKGHVNGS